MADNGRCHRLLVPQTGTRPHQSTPYTWHRRTVPQQLRLVLQVRTLLLVPTVPPPLDLVPCAVPSRAGISIFAGVLSSFTFFFVLIIRTTWGSSVLLHTYIPQASDFINLPVDAPSTRTTRDPRPSYRLSARRVCPAAQTCGVAELLPACTAPHPHPHPHPPLAALWPSTLFRDSSSFASI